MLKVCLYCDRTEALHSRINLNLTGKRKKEKKHESTRTRTARALRVTMMMGQTGLYFATKRAVFPLCSIVSASTRFTQLYNNAQEKILTLS